MSPMKKHAKKPTKKKAAKPAPKKFSHLSDSEKELVGSVCGGAQGQGRELRGRWQQEGDEGHEEGEVKPCRPTASAGLCVDLVLGSSNVCSCLRD